MGNKNGYPKSVDKFGIIEVQLSKGSTSWIDLVIEWATFNGLKYHKSGADAASVCILIRIPEHSTISGCLSVARSEHDENCLEFEAALTEYDALKRVCASFVSLGLSRHG